MAAAEKEEDVQNDDEFSLSNDGIFYLLEYFSGDESRCQVIVVPEKKIYFLINAMKICLEMTYYPISNLNTFNSVTSYLRMN